MTTPWLLWQLADSAFPAGGFAHSFGLEAAWQQGEVRATHRLTPRPVRDWRTRKDPFETVWPTVRVWFEAEPDRIGKDLFERLQGERPGVFPDGQLRTFQRRVKGWRQAVAPVGLRSVTGARADVRAVVRRGRAASPGRSRGISARRRDASGRSIRHRHGDSTA